MPLLKSDFLDDDDLPVLNSVVKCGNESIIKSTRQNRQAADELETLRRNTPVSFNMPEIPGLSGDPDAQPVDKEIHDTQRPYSPLKALPSIHPSPPEQAVSEDDIELLIDDLVDRHITELRLDIRTLLDRVSRQP